MEVPRALPPVCAREGKKTKIRPGFPNLRRKGAQKNTGGRGGGFARENSKKSKHHLRLPVSLSLSVSLKFSRPLSKALEQAIALRAPKLDPRAKPEQQGAEEQEKRGGQERGRWIWETSSSNHAGYRVFAAVHGGAQEEHQRDREA